MATTTLARPARKTGHDTRAKAVQLTCLAAIRAYIAALETSTALEEMAMVDASVQASFELSQSWEVDAELQLVDALLLGGESFTIDHDGIRYGTKIDMNENMKVLSINYL